MRKSAGSREPRLTRIQADQQVESRCAADPQNEVGVTILWGKLKDKWENTAIELAEKPIGNDAAFCEQRGDVEYLASRRRADMTTHASNDASAETVYVTLTGLPLAMKFDWPFHRSTSGADFWVLHAHVRLEGSEGLTAPVAVNMSATVREVFPSLEPKDTEAPMINAIRKEVDRRQLEFVKSGKLVPLQFSSRHYDFKRNQWAFGKAEDATIRTFLERKIYWQTKVHGGEVWLGGCDRGTVSADDYRSPGGSCEPDGGRGIDHVGEAVCYGAAGFDGARRGV